MIKKIRMGKRFGEVKRKKARGILEEKKRKEEQVYGKIWIRKCMGSDWSLIFMLSLALA